VEYAVELKIKHSYCRHKRPPGTEDLTDTCIMEKTFPNSTLRVEPHNMSPFYQEKWMVALSRHARGHLCLQYGYFILSLTVLYFCMTRYPSNRNAWMERLECWQENPGMLVC
jgi:hypothetical protein